MHKLCLYEFLTINEHIAYVAYMVKNIAQGMYVLIKSILNKILVIFLLNIIKQNH